MTAATVILERIGDAAVVTLDRPNAYNALDAEMVDALREAVQRVASDDSVRAMLLRANGAHFCVGGDLRVFASHGDELGSAVYDLADSLHGAIATVHRLAIPVVVAVQGNAAGAGMSLACLGDVCLAARSAKFRLAYTAVGLTPDGGSTWSLPRLVGPRLAADLALTNRTLSADEALVAGLVSRVVDDDDLQAQAEALTAQLAAGPTHALVVAKRLLATQERATLEEHLAREATAIGEAGAQADTQQRIAAFVTRRT